MVTLIFANFTPKIQHDDSFGYTITTTIDQNFVHSNSTGLLNSWDNLRVYNFDLTIIEPPGLGDINRWYSLFRKATFRRLNLGLSNSSYMPLVSLTIILSAWFGHIHFLAKEGIVVIGGSRQSRCQ